MGEEQKKLQVEVQGDVLDEIKKREDGEIDWWDYEDQINESIRNGDPDRAEALLAQEHPLILHEEHILEELNTAMQEKYGRNSYLQLDPELENKHVILKNKK